MHRISNVERSGENRVRVDFTYHPCSHTYGLDQSGRVVLCVEVGPADYIVPGRDRSAALAAASSKFKELALQEQANAA